MNVLTTDKTVFKDTDYTEFLNIIDDIISNKTASITAPPPHSQHKLWIKSGNHICNSHFLC